MTQHAILVASMLFCLCLAATSRAADAFDVTIRVEADKPLDQLRPVWRFFGADEPN